MDAQVYLPDNLLLHLRNIKKNYAKYKSAGALRCDERTLTFNINEGS